MILRFTSCFRRVRARRGSALVEFSILTMAFVPLILLPMYFQDSMRFQLDAQEAVASTIWDFCFADYQENTADSLKGSFESSAQARYANLWPVNKTPKDSDKKAGPWVDFAWQDQISCSVDKDFATGGYTTLGLLNLAKQFHNEYTKGGLVTCQGRISVENHYVPEEFTQNFHEQKLFPHQEAIPLPVERFAVMVDTWTLHDPANVDKTGSGNSAYYERVKFCWEKPLTYWLFFGAWWVYALSLISDLSITALAAWDDPTIIKLSAFHYGDNNTNASDYKRNVQVSGGQNNFYTIPYFDDGEGDLAKYKETFDARDTYYLGCQEFGEDCSD